MDLDAAAQANATLSDGAFTLGGYPGIAYNNAGARATMSNVSGSGMLIQPAAGTDLNTGTWNVPQLCFPYAGLLTGTQSWTPNRRHRVWARIGSANYTANYDNSIMGACRTLSYATADDESYVIKRGYGTSGLGLQALTVSGGTNVSGFIDLVAGVAASNDVQVVEINNGYMACGYGQWAAGWPALSAITWTGFYKLTAALVNAADARTVGAFIAAQVLASGTLLDVYVPNLRVDLETA